MKTRQEGMSIVSVMVAVGLLGIFSVLFLNVVKATLQAAKNIGDSADVENLRRYIRIGHDCNNTTAALPPSCPVGTSVALMRFAVGTSALVQIPNGTIFTTIGDYNLKASCGISVKEFIVEYSLKSTNVWDELFKIPVRC